MTDDLSDIERAAEAATPGPWQSSEHCGAQVCAGKIIEERPGHIAIEAPGFFLLEIDPFVYERPVDYEDGEEDDEDDYEEDSEQRAFADARFIALANPARLLALVSEVRGLRAKDDEFPETLRIIAHAAALDFGDELTLEGLLAGLRGLVESHDEMVEQIEKRGGASRAIK